MLKGRKKLLFFMVFIFALSALVYFQVWNADASTILSEIPENQEIMKTIENGYSAIAYAAETTDVSLLPEVFLDTADYKPSDDVKKNVEQIFGDEIANNAGYLTSMQAKYLARGKAEKYMNAAIEKAKAENRELTKQEFQQVIIDSNGVIPPDGYYKSPTGKTQLSFERIEISGDKATVYYDDGAAYQKATLLKVNGKWFITNIEALQIHY